jgi:hypothetical protein
MNIEFLFNSKDMKIRMLPGSTRERALLKVAQEFSSSAGKWSFQNLDPDGVFVIQVSMLESETEKP